MPKRKRKKDPEKFLDKFTEEVILNVSKRYPQPKKNVPEKKGNGFKSMIIEKHEIKKPVQQPIRIVKLNMPAPKITPLPTTAPHLITPNEKTTITKTTTQIKPLTPAKPPLTPSQPIQQIKMINIPVAPGEIDFGKINFLVKDNLVTYIECPGMDKNLLIRKAGNLMRIQITLNKEEILSIIKSFSEKARIPLVQGMLNARVGNLEISAVISGTSVSSFVLKKDIISFSSQQPTQLSRPYMMRPPIPAQKFPNPPINRPFVNQVKK